jgi:hypothetical protein
VSDRTGPKDLLVLVADADAEASLRALLARPEALGIRAVAFDVRRHLERDAGCRGKCQDFLRPFVNRYAHALVVFDLHGSGRESLSPADLEERIERSLANSGWEGRSAVVVLDPELEIWVWSDSPQVDHVLGWSGRVPGLRQWLSTEGHVEPPSPKPNRPKEVLFEALSQVRKPWSQSLYADLAKRVSVSRCTDRAFLKLRSVLGDWFGLSKP